VVKRKRGNRSKKLKTLVDIVIPVYGRFDLLEQCLHSIPDAAGNIPYTLTIVDNDSPEENVDMFYRGIKDAKIIRNTRNMGFIGASNLGAKNGRSPLIFFLNSDVILKPGSIDKLVRTMDTPEIGICGMKLLFPSHKQIESSNLRMDIRPADTIQHIGLMTNVRGEVIHSFISWSADSKKVNMVDIDDEGKPKPYNARTVMGVTGAAMMVKRIMFQKAGGFDREFGMGTYEDVSLCMAARKLGYNVVVNPDAVGVHYVGATSEKYQASFPLNENYQRFLSKWHQDMKQWDYNIL